ncbi:MAG: Uma2 family endonuclease [Pirellulales bacterium]|nr:Uma2 family endonuclease [Pirellulales bacterium]
MSTMNQMPNWDLVVQPVDRLFTAADLEAFPTELPSGMPIDYELDNGRLVFIMAPPGDMHGAAQSLIATELVLQGQKLGHGKARTEVGIVLWRNPDRVVGADVAFIAKKSLPLKVAREGYLETIPELVVEIRSKNDSLAYMRRKVEHYLKAGVEVVWLADPAATTITIHSPGAEPIIRGAEDTLELPGLIPGFSLPVADVFRE